MPRYAVDLYEGKNLVTYEVEASSEEEANEKALAAREKFFQENTSREALEEERKQIQSRMENQPTRPLRVSMSAMVIRTRGSSSSGFRTISARIGSTTASARTRADRR